MANHADNPNSMLTESEGAIHLHTLRAVAKGEEVRQALRLDSMQLCLVCISSAISNAATPESNVLRSLQCEQCTAHQP